MELENASLANAYSTDPELQDAFPAMPRRVPGVRTVPLTPQEVLIFGANKPLHLRGTGARGQLLDLLPAMDGTRTVADLKAQFPQISDEDMNEVICTLHAHGLLVDGLAARPSGNDFPTYAIRKVGHARHHSSEDDVVALLGSTRLLVAAPERYLEQTKVALDDSGFGTVVALDLDGPAPETLAGRFDAALVIADSCPETETRWHETLHAARIPAFRISLGQKIQVGPFILPEKSAPIHCVLRQVPEQEPSEDASAPLSLAVHRFVLHWSRISTTQYYNRVVQWSGALADDDEYVGVIREPGCPASGLEHLPALEPEQAEVYQAHFQSEICPKEFLAPSHHLTHYAAKNIKSTQNKSAPTSDNGALPFRPDVVEQAHGPDHLQTRLSRFLAMAFGYRPYGDAAIAMRYVPSGGSLDAATPFLVFRGIEGIPDGGYRYSENTQSLDPVPTLTNGLSLLGDTDGPQIRLFVLSAHQRIISKYRLSGARICCLDGGVSLLNVAHLSNAFGLGAGFNFAPRPAEIMKEFNFSRKPPVLYFPVYSATIVPGIADAFGTGSEKSEPLEPWMDQKLLQALPAEHQQLFDAKDTTPDDFLDLVKSRRSMRTFSDKPVSKTVLMEQVAIVEALIASFPFRDFKPGLIIRVAKAAPDLAAGTYTYEFGSGDLREAEGSEFYDYEFANQTSLTKSPVLLFVTGDLSKAVNELGFAGWRKLLMMAGVVSGALWLANTRTGLGGCVFGGLIESAARLTAGVDGFTTAPLLGYTFGYPQGREH